ncbi:hypothetical protein FORC9_1446 [Vibrio vulnificus]|nr:hypothetical protein FORC9_1446 [Vibrio vulnificus]
MDYQPNEGELVQLQNGLNQGLFIVLEAGDNASLVSCVELEGFMLSSSKSLSYGEAIKVMHDRMSTAARMNTLMPMALVG